MNRILPPNARMVPAEAELVFEGVIFDVYQWQQELFDGSFTTFEMLKRADSVVTIALDDDNQVVTIDEEQPDGLVRRGGLPVGSAEKYDYDPLAAAKRELVEETGLSFRNWRLLQVRQPETKVEWFVYIFAATGLESFGEQNLDPGEQIRVTRSDYDTFQSNNPIQKQFLREFPDAQSLREFVEAQPLG